MITVREFILICLCIFGGWFSYQQYKEKNIYKNISESVSSQLEVFDAELGRAQQHYLEEDELKEIYLKNISETVKDQIELYRGEISSLSVARVVVEGSGGGRVVPRKASVALGPKQNSVETQESSPPPDLGPVDYSSWTYKDWRLSAAFESGDFTYNLTQRFDVVLVEADAKSAKASYLEMWELDSEGKRIPSSVKVDSFNVYRKKQESTFSFLDPHIELSVGFMFGKEGFDFGPELSGSLSSYGSFRFVRLGIYKGQDSLGVSASPVSINLGQLTDTLDNFWVSPAYYFSTNSFYGASVGATF